MVNFKKVLAVVLSTTMVIGGSITAFAEDAPTSGSADGAGASEGHVDKEIVDVVLPTTTTTTFAYTMDPERLITATDAAKYAEGTVFPTTGDTGVYFLTEANKYENTSNKVQVINKGAVDQMLTVEAQLTASEGGKDIAILSDVPDAEATTAGLYLAAKVAKVTQALSTNKATWIINLEGNDDNYVVAVKDNAYVYQKKTSGLSAWKAADIEVTGAVTDGIAVESDTTAPKITLTWKFEAIPDTAPSWTANTELSDVSETPETPAITDEDAHLVWYNGTFWLGSSASAGLVEDEITVEDLESVTIQANDHDAVDVKAVATIGNDNGYWVKVKFEDAEGLENENGTYTMVVVIGNKRYTGTHDFE